MCFRIIHVALSNYMIQTSVIGIDTSYLNTYTYQSAEQTLRYLNQDCTKKYPNFLSVGQDSCSQSHISTFNLL